MGLLGKGNRNTNSIGDISEAAIITRFLQLGYVVLTPHGGNQRYDLVIEDADGQYWRIQCKTDRIEDNGTVVAFDTANHNYALKKSSGDIIEGNVTILLSIVRSSIRSISFQWIRSALPEQIFG
jgi:PD-(D/E)XK endonuclease